MPIKSIKAQEANMEGFKSCIAKLKTLNVYAYETETTAIFPDGTKDVMSTKLMMDVAQKRLFYKNDFQVMLVTSKWIYKADLLNEHIQVFNMGNPENKKYKKELPELDEIFKSGASSLIDTLIVKNAQLVSAKKVGNLTTYTLSFPKTYYIKELRFVYNHKKQLPESIFIKTFQSESKDKKGNSVGTTYEALSKNYSNAIPESTFDTLPYFQIKGNKVVLNQYKNYKVSSIL